MATNKFWTGGGNDGVFDNLANWSEATAFANNDVLTIGATNQDITGGLTHAYTGITLVVTPGYGGSIGGAGGSLSFSSAASIRYAGRGAFARFTSAGTVATASLEHVGSSFVAITGGTWTNIDNSLGLFDIAAAAVVTRLNNIMGTGTAGYNSTAFTNLYNGGNFTYRRNATNCYAMAGKTVQENNGTANYTLVTALQVWPGATYNKRSSGADVAGTIFPRGKYTVAGNVGGGVATVDLGNLEIWGGAEVDASAVPGVPFDTSGFAYRGSLAEGSYSLPPSS